MNTHSVAVIIPYFQRRGGILRKALDSIAAQVVPPGTHVRIVLIDDSSPFAPRDDMGGLVLPGGMDIRLIRQPNAGPAASRNTGLRHLPSDADLVAFLDSDDHWAPDHLAAAIDALDRGFDFYFCDSAVPPGTMFDGLRTMRENTGREGVDPARFRPVPDAPGLHAFNPNTLGRSMVEEYLCQTSTIVVRRTLLQNLRFEPKLYHAGEDWLMWLRLALRSRRVCFSTFARSHRGEGINLYRGAHDRLGSRNLRRLFSMIHANELMAAEPELDRDSAAFCRTRGDDLRLEAAAILLHPKAMRSFLSAETRKIALGLEPGLWRRLPGQWIEVIGRRLGVGRAHAVGDGA